MSPQHDVRQHDSLEAGARIGLAAYGLVHVLIGWVALQLAWGGGGQEASNTGALQELADKPFGTVLLWIVAVGLLALVLWQLATAVWGFGGEDGAARLRKKGSSAARAVVYAVLGFSAARIAVGSGGGGGDSAQEGFTARLLSAPAGRVLVVAVALAIVAVGVRQVWTGVTTSFTDDLRADALSGRHGDGIRLAGTIGFVAKGLAIIVVGVLFGWAAASYDPDKAGGLDDALTTVREQPFGPYLLTAVALGIIVFGAYCFAWARYVRAR